MHHWAQAMQEGLRLCKLSLTRARALQGTQACAAASGRTGFLPPFACVLVLNVVAPTVTLAYGSCASARRKDWPDDWHQDGSRETETEQGQIVATTAQSKRSCCAQHS